MKIGILSMQHVINYGSFLQAYALKMIIESLGHDVCFVAIKPGRQIIEQKHPSSRKLTVDKYIFKRIDHIVFQKRRNSLFEEKLFPSIAIDKPELEESCDMVIIGSDEVFNCCQSSRWGFSTQLFGDIEVASLTYAASCGFTSYEKVLEMGITEELINSLHKLKDISVRDNNTRDFVQKLIRKQPKQHLDPVLVYDWDKEVTSQMKYRDYILVYAYDNRINNEEEIKAIKDFAQKEHKQLISFGVYQRWCDKNVLCTPFELLAYFDGADYVITDTFHGTVISIKRNKQFATLIRNSNKNKLTDLLSRFDLMDREVTRISTLCDTIKQRIDYNEVNARLQAEQFRTIEYLQSNLCEK